MTPEPTDKLDATTQVVVNGPEDAPPIRNGSYDVTPPDLTGLLEPDARKRARPVLRGARRRKAPGLPERCGSVGQRDRARRRYRSRREAAATASADDTAPWPLADQKRS